MMQLSLVAIGKLKDASERSLFDRYAKRINGISGPLGFSKLTVREFSESQAKTTDLRKRQESELVCSAISNVECRVALDERGKTYNSVEFSKWMMRQRDQGLSPLAFVIGGPDGHDQSVMELSTHTLSLSPLTLPHGLARIILAEQVYRAMTILSGHPYHRT